MKTIVICVKNREKRLKRLFLLIVVLICFWCFGIDSKATEYSGSCGTNTTWKIDTTEGTMVISGSGTVEVSDVVQKAPWYEYKSYVRSVVVSEGITELGAGAIYEFPNLTQVTLPDTLISIGDYAFDGCSSLKEICFPSKLKKIGNGAFYLCKELEEVIVPAHVTELGTAVFASCTNLKKAEIEEGIKTLPDYFFNNCKSLNEVILPDSLTKMGAAVFDNCISLVSIELPSKITEIGGATFGDCTNLENVTLPTQLITMGETTFGGCISLETVVIPENVVSIPSYTFWNCTKLKSVNIPQTVTNIADYAFYGCENLKEIVIPRNTNILNDSFSEYPSDFTIYGYMNTSAYEVAVSLDISFVAFDDIEEYEVSLQKKEYIYSGLENTPEVAVYFHGKMLKENSDYTVQYSNHVEEGTAAVIVTGLEPYEFYKAEEYYIQPADLSLAFGQLSQENFIYDGNEKRPKVEVKMNDIILVEERDYTVTYSNNINAGKGYAKIEGQGNYSGSFTKEFVIEKRSQTITANSYTKAYGSKPFYLKASSNRGGKLSYKTSNSKIVTITSAGQVKIKGYGKAIITIFADSTQNENCAEKKISITVIPKKANLKSVVSQKGKKASVTWKIDKTVTGYQLVYGSNKNFKSATSKKVLSKKTKGKYILTKLEKGKLYYVRLRQYKVVGKSTYYGTWSKVIRIRAK